MISKKNKLREGLKKKRKKLELIEVSSKSDLISDKIIASELYKNAKSIMGYLAFNNEVNIDKVLEKALEDGKKVCIPKVFGQTNMKPVYIETMDNFVIGEYGIRTVKEDELIFADPKDIDLVFVPGLGFEKNGSRIGFGAGYYDRFLPKAKLAKLIGVGYLLQLVENIPIDKNDVLLDYIVNELDLIKCHYDSNKDLIGGKYFEME